MALISKESPLLLLPQTLHRKQILFLDGIRHAAEFADFGYTRLANALAEVSHHFAGEFEGDVPHHAAPIFLDAWAVVDAIDRMRALLTLLPRARIDRGSADWMEFEERMQPIRDLRNVSDHIAQRADYIVARDGTALGYLRWISMPPEPSQNVLSCIIVPGTISSRSRRLLNPFEHESFAMPVDLVTLTAGEYSADLTDTMRYVRRIIAHLERSLVDELDRSG